MRAASFSDIHGSFSIFKKSEKLLKSSDAVILCGDITDFGDNREIKKGIDELRKYFTGDILAVTGNCDYPSCEEALDSMKINIHRKIIEKYGINFAGLGGSLVTPFSTPNEYSEKEYEFFLGEMEKNLTQDIPLVLIAHQPPFDTQCDIIGSGDHVGSRAVRSFIEKNDPLVCFTGHIHEARGEDKIGKTIVINPGQAKNGFVGIMDFNSGKSDIYLENINNF